MQGKYYAMGKYWKIHFLDYIDAVDAKYLCAFNINRGILKTKNFTYEVEISEV